MEFFDSANTWLGQQTAYQLQGTHAWTRVQAVVDSVPANTTQLKVSVDRLNQCYMNEKYIMKRAINSIYLLIRLWYNLGNYKGRQNQ